MVWFKNKKEPQISSAKHIYRTGYSDGNLTFETFYKLSKLPCFYCGKGPNNKYNRFIHDQKYGNQVSKYAVDNGTFIYNGLDKDGPSHNEDNVVPCCWSCNKAKSEMTRKQFKIWINKIYKHFIIGKKNK